MSKAKQKAAKAVAAKEFLPTAQHLTIPQAAARHNATRNFIRASIIAGNLRAVVAGRKYLIATAELDRFFAAL